MKRIVLKITICALTLALIFCALPLFGAVPGSYAEEAKLDGIDYNRFTQKAMPVGTAKTSEATLKLNNLVFKGKLTGTLGLTIDEMNDIIRNELKLLGLTLEEVKVLSSLGADLDGKVTKEIVKKLAVALSNYIPGGVGPVTPADMVKALAYGAPDVDGVIIDKTKGYVVDQFKDAAKAEREALAKNLGKGVQKVPGVGLGVMGFAVNSVDVALELADTTEFEKFCKLMEEQFEKIAKFYILTSQKMNQKAEEKNSVGSALTFDNAVAENDAVFLGVDVKMKFTLSGVLKRQTGPDEVVDWGDNSGTYEGNLTLVAEGADMEHFDAVFAKTSDLWTYSGMADEWCQILCRYPGLASAQEDMLKMALDTPNKRTVLKRTLVGRFSMTISSWKKGEIKPSLSGKFNNVSDTLEFVFEHNIAHEFNYREVDRETLEDLGFPLEQYHLKSVPGMLAEIHISWVGNKAAHQLERAGMVEFGGDGRTLALTKRQIGTIWYPLEFGPELTIKPT